MPIYEYVCLDCKSHFEVLRSMKEADFPIKCDKCLGDRTTRCLSVFFTQSGGKVIAGGNGGCAGCSSHSCSTCGR